MAAVQPPQVSLTFAATSLPTKDLLSKSDPFFVLYSKTRNGLTKLLTSEAIRNNENPKWTATHRADYYFETIQEFRIEVYDSDSDINFNDLSKHDKIGYADFHLANVLGGYNSSIELPVVVNGGQNHHRAKVIVSGIPLAQSRLKAQCSFRCSDLKRGTYLGSKDETILHIIKLAPDGKEHIIYRSEMIWDSQDPKYADFKLCLGQLADGNLNQQFIIRIIRWKNASKQETLGEIKVTPQQCSKLIHEPAKKMDLMEGGKSRGQLIIDNFTIVEEPTFFDFLQGGLDFSLTVAIDVTGSNGDPKTVDSLHYIDYSGKKPNQYIDALRTIGNVVAHYCQKQFIPTLGFGGFVSIDGQPPKNLHCFPFSLQTQFPYCDGIEGIVQCYVNNMPRITLSGPTYFKEIIDSAAIGCARPFTPDWMGYSILLIIADGVVNDLEATVDAICAASDKPLSIIIVGVGKADFSQMRFLDGDEKRITSKRFGPAKRDLVQFVPYLEFANNPAELARQTLAEIPQQVLDFMNLHKIKPLVRQAPPPQQFQQQPAPQQYQQPPPQ